MRSSRKGKGGEMERKKEMETWGGEGERKGEGGKKDEEKRGRDQHQKTEMNKGRS